MPKERHEHERPGADEVPATVDAFIRARLTNPSCDWQIQKEGSNFETDKVQYICRWLNHSFQPFTKRQRANYERFRAHYDEIKRKKHTR